MNERDLAVKEREFDVREAEAGVRDAKRAMDEGMASLKADYERACLALEREKARLEYARDQQAKGFEE